MVAAIGSLEVASLAQASGYEKPGESALAQRRFDFGRERFPNDFGEFDFAECDGDRGLIFRTLPLIDRLRFVTDPPSFDGLACPASGVRRRWLPRDGFFFPRLLNARNSSSSASVEWNG